MEEGTTHPSGDASLRLPPHVARGARAFAHAAVPSRRSVAVALTLAALAAAAYAAARESSVFAVREIEVRGAGPGITREVRRTLEPLVGRSLVALGSGDVSAPLERIAGVAGVHYDRAFPDSLVVVVRREHPVAVLRRGPQSWLVSGRGRVLRRVHRPGRVRLPRIWVGGASRVAVGTTIGGRNIATALDVSRTVRARGLGTRVRAIGIEDQQLVLLAGSRTEVRLGAPRDIALKLAVARRMLEVVGEDAAYLDIRDPERPVAGVNPQVEG